MLEYLILKLLITNEFVILAENINFKWESMLSRSSVSEYQCLLNCNFRMSAQPCLSIIAEKAKVCKPVVAEEKIVLFIAAFLFFERLYILF